MTILELAERCEAATGPDYLLEKEIWTAVVMEEISGGFSPLGTPPNYTASVDAALTLVPEGWLVNEISQSIGWREWSCVLDVQPEPGTTRFSRACATAALAICAAALRARAA